MADETVETLTERIVVDASQAMTELEKFRQTIDAYKNTIGVLREQTKESFAAIAESIKRSAEEAKKAALVDLEKKGPQPGQTIAEATTAINEKYKQDTKALTQAMQELKREEREAIVEGSKFGGDPAKAAEAYRQKIDSLKKSMLEMKQQQGTSLQDASKGLAMAGKGTPTELNQALKELTKETENTQGAFGKLGSVSSFVFGTVLGFTAITVLRNLIGALKDAAQAGYDFTKAVFQLEVGVRALQRSGIDITIKDVYENIDALKKKFGTFSTTELVQGQAAFLNLVRDMGYTKKQIFELTDAVATLATVNGRSMDEVQRTVALALSSGYTEGLQRLGVSINRVTIAEKAAELGWKGGYTSLTEQQRAYATYLLILEKTAKYQDDLTAYQDTLPGLIDKTTASIVDQNVAIGKSLTPLKLFGDQLKLIGLRLLAWLPIIAPIIAISKIFLILADGARIFNKEIQMITSSFKIFLNALSQPIKNNAIVSFFTEAKKSVDGFLANHPRLKQFLDDANMINKGKVPSPLGDVPVEPGVNSAAEEEASKVADATAKLQEDIAKGQLEFQQQSEDAWIKYWQDLADIDRDGARKREELFRDLQQKLIDIDLNASRDVAKANRDYANDLAKIDRDAANSVAEAKLKQHDKEIDDEKKFQERMRKMQEDYLLDLDDAVRMLDARKIRQLSRRYALDRTQAIREHNLDVNEQKTQFARELQEIERQRIIKRQERAIEQQERLYDIRLQAQQERAEAQIKYNQDLEDLRRNMEIQRAERKIKLDQQLQDLARNMQNRLNMTLQGMVGEYNITVQMAAKIFGVLRSYFGQNGAVEQLYNYYMSYLARMGNVQVTTPGTLTTPKGFAEGGSFIATHPVSAIFGEGGVPELVQATPLGRTGRDVNKFFGDLSGAGLSSGGNGSLKLMISLTPGLEASIVEKSMKELADVLVSVERAR